MKSIRSFLIGIIISGSLAASLLFLHAQETAMPVQSVTPDSIIQLTADSLGLPLVSPAALPASGTFFLMVPGPGGIMALPYPCPPGGPALPTYAIINGVFLVDGTGGQVRLNNRLAANGTVNAALAAQAAGVVNLVDQVQGAVTLAVPPMRMAGGMMTMDAGGGFYPGGKTNIMVSAFNFTPDYGTNLYLAQPDAASNYFSGIVSNTFADIQYEIQYTTDLTQTNWQSANWFVYGSEVTNWTPFSVPAVSPTNLFLRVRSWQDDGSGLPIWWQEQYFGTTGVDPYGDPAGDGWNNLQKFQNGMNPNVFYTPPSPQGVTMTYNANNNTTTINWQPSPGPVTGYTLETPGGNVYPAASATSYQVAGSPGSFSLQANYSGGNSPLTSAISSQQNAASASFVQGPSGFTYLAVPGLSANAVTVRIIFADNLSGAVSNYDIPVGNITNGLYQFPASWSPPSGYYGEVYVQALDTNGNPSALKGFTSYTGPWPEPFNWSEPYLDGRVQLKQNLIFKLRAATKDFPFEFTDETNSSKILIFTNAPNCVVADYYQDNSAFLYGDGLMIFNPLWPFVENTYLENFAFSMANIDASGHITTGVTGSYDNYYGSSLFSVELELREAELAGHEVEHGD